MKKIWLVLFLSIFSTTSVMAMPRHYHGHPVPAARKVPAHRPGNWESFFSGLAGSAIGSYIVASQYQPTIYSDTRCVILKSRMNGQIIKKCVNLANSENWVRQDVYDILYVE